MLKKIRSIYLLAMLAMIFIPLLGCQTSKPALDTEPVAETTEIPAKNKNITLPSKIALLIPQTGYLHYAGLAIQTGFIKAYEDTTDKPDIKIYDESASGANSLQDQYQQVLKNKADYMIGPLEKNKVQIIASMASPADEKNMPVILLNNLNTPVAKLVNLTEKNIYQFALSPADEAKQIAEKAIQDGHQKALLITLTGEWGKNIALTIQHQFEQKGGIITETVFTDATENINEQLQAILQKRSFDMVFMIAPPVLARQIKPLIRYYQRNAIPVYSTSLVYTGVPDPVKDSDLNGVIFCDIPLVLDQTGAWASIRQNKLLASHISDTTPFAIRLFALGWDAAYLVQHFEQLNHAEPIWGATGQLSLGENHVIERTLLFAVFKNGIPETIA